MLGVWNEAPRNAEAIWGNKFSNTFGRMPPFPFSTCLRFLRCLRIPWRFLSFLIFFVFGLHCNLEARCVLKDFWSKISRRCSEACHCYNLLLEYVGHHQFTICVAPFEVSLRPENWSWACSDGWTQEYPIAGCGTACISGGSDKVCCMRFQSEA